MWLYIDFSLKDNKICKAFLRSQCKVLALCVGCNGGKKKENTSQQMRLKQHGCNEAQISSPIECF